MAYWDFSDVFEEQGVVRSPFYGGFGLIAADSIPKPSLNAFAMLHRLGDQRIALASDSALATKDSSGRIVEAVWNYAPPSGTGATYTLPTGSAGPDKSFDLEFRNVPAHSKVEVYRVDETHGNVLHAFDAMGRPPADLTRDQIATLRAAGAMAPPERMTLQDGKLHLTVPVHGLAVVVVETR
jgi:xylan 1,4-beta-xylosidase